MNCSYCDYRCEEKANLKGYWLKAFDKTHDIGSELSWWEWIRYFSKFEPVHFELTGGEPLGYKDLDQLLMHFRGSWAITSNTMHTDMIKKVPVVNCVAWTASYHFRNDKIFFKNIDILQHRGFNVRVTIVFTPENYKEAFEAVRKVNKRKIGVNLHPVLKQGFSWEENIDIFNKAQELCDGKMNIFINDVGYRWAGERYTFCEAGINYFMVHPDGTVLRCYSQLLTSQDCGHISQFETYKTMRPCDIACMFPCDKKIKKRAHNDTGMVTL